MLNLFTTLTDGDQKRIAAVILIIIANFVFAVVGALVKGGFVPANGGLDFKKLPEFFVKQILPYVVGLAFFEAYLHLVPPSESVQLLFHKAAEIDSIATPMPYAVASNSWAWLDPTALWVVYGSMVAMLVKQLSSNFAYLFGKGLTAAQAASK